MAKFNLTKESVSTMVGKALPFVIAIGATIVSTKSEIDKDAKLNKIAVLEERIKNLENK